MSGVFGVTLWAKCFHDLYYGTNSHEHLGRAWGGMATWDNNPHRVYHKIAKVPFSARFAEESERISGNQGIGVISSDDIQPLIFHTKNGPYAICVQGNFRNKEKLGNELYAQGCVFTEMTPDEKMHIYQFNKAEIVGHIINSADSIVDGIKKVWQKIDGEGSISLLVITHEGIYAARDKRGTFPLTIGHKMDAWAVASETTAFANLGYEIQQELRAGEIGLMNLSGYKTLEPGKNESKICAYLYVFTSFPSAIIGGKCVEPIRYKMGATLWNRFNDLRLKCDYVAGIPDSGTAYGKGAANASHQDSKRPLLKKGGDRSYNFLTQALRDEAAHHKIIVVKELITDQTILLLDDSLVTNNQLRKLIQKIGDCRPKGIYLSLGCPPLIEICPFEVSTRERDELAARRAIMALEGRPINGVDITPYLDPKTEQYRKMVDWIRRDVNKESGAEVVNQIIYPTMEETISAIGLPADHLCTYCWTGKM